MAGNDGYRCGCLRTILLTYYQQVFAELDGDTARGRCTGSPAAEPRAKGSAASYLRVLHASR